VEGGARYRTRRRGGFSSSKNDQSFTKPSAVHYADRLIVEAGKRAALVDKYLHFRKSMMTPIDRAAAVLLSHRV